MSTVQTVPVWDDHLFWLEILQDHAFFVRDHLSPAERNWIQSAQQYIDAFGTLIQKLQRIPTQADAASPEMIRFAADAWPVASGYYQLEGTLQNLRIQNQVNLNLTPTYLNGTLHENQEYLRRLTFYMQGHYPTPLPLTDLMDLWLEDQLGHASLLNNILDPIETEIIQRTQAFMAQFRSFILINRQVKGYLRFSPIDIPRIRAFARDVGNTVLAMNQFIAMVVEKYRDDEVFSRTTLRFLEHHFPESCYFIRSLSVYAPELQQFAMTCSLRKPSFQPNI